VALQNVALKVTVTPLLIGGASLAGRRWGNRVSGWAVGLPLTSGPVAFFLARDQGNPFAAAAAVGMLAATISQVAFALAYRLTACRGGAWALLAGCSAFAASTVALDHLRLPAWAVFALVVSAIAAAAWVALRPPSRGGRGPRRQPPDWDVPLRMAVATGVVIAITGLAPALGPRLAGLLSPFPVFGAVLALFAHRSQGPAAASEVLGGLLVGLFAPAVFFFALALALPAMGLAAFAVAAGLALAAQGLSLLLIPR
jgi:hypothetical protein